MPSTSMDDSSGLLNRESEPTTSMDDIYNWAIYSPYSPLNLQHLNQPRLQGAPRHLAGEYTFRDAFEDLLTAEAGRPLPSVPELIKRKSWDTSSTLHVFQWVRDLGIQGLWGSYFALAPSVQNRFDWMPSRNVAIPHTRWLHFRVRPMTSHYPFNHREGVFLGPIGLFPGLLRPFREQLEEPGTMDDDLFQFISSFVSPELLRAIQDRPGDGPNKIFDELLHRPIREDQEDWPATEEDMYSFVDKSSMSPRDPCIRDKKDYGAKQKNDESASSTTKGSTTTQAVACMEEDTSTPSVTTTAYADGSKHVQTTERHSSDGKTEVTTTSQHYDAQGNLMAESRESSTTRTWSGRLPGGDASFSWTWGKNRNTEGVKEENNDEDDKKRREKGGWFWER